MAKESRGGLVPEPPEAPRPERLRRRILGFNKPCDAATPARGVSRVSAAPLPPPSASFAASGMLTPRMQTPRSLPPLELLSEFPGRGISKASSSSRCGSARANSRCSEAPTAPPTPDVLNEARAPFSSCAPPAAHSRGVAPRPRGGPAPKERPGPADEEAVADPELKHLVSTRRQASTQGGRSFFKWSFRGGGLKSTAQQRYAVTSG
mmetsp:Transcript_20439/g.36295  ORF Transcript_20439/g.36295 Transcript_20439/m.36295 type:complete len:207 (+) Transcript_20439:123-743(+)